MKLRVRFFATDLVDAIGAGIYQVSVSYQGRTRVLYVGESVLVLVRCASHLYELNKDPTYFGFTPETIEQDDITLEFSLLERIDDSSQRKRREKEYIRKLTPLSQSQLSDHQKEIEAKVNALRDFLEGAVDE